MFWISPSHLVEVSGVKTHLDRRAMKSSSLFQVQKAICSHLSCCLCMTLLCGPLSLNDSVCLCWSEKQLILEIPALPVNTGSNVTLLCKPRNGSAKKSYFFRDKDKLGEGPEGKWILHNVQQSDEGLYSCSTLIHQSPQSRLKVKGQSSDITPALKIWVGGKKNLKLIPLSLYSRKWET